MVPTPSSFFLRICEDRLGKLAKDLNIPLGLFLLAEPKPVALEKRGRLFSRKEASKMEDEEKDELIKVFTRDEPEPVSLVDVKDSLLETCAARAWQTVRLYLVHDDHALLSRARDEVSAWE